MPICFISPVRDCYLASLQISVEHYSRHIWREIQSVILALIDSKDGLNTTIFHSGLLHRGVLGEGGGEKGRRRKGGDYKKGA